MMVNQVEWSSGTTPPSKVKRREGHNAGNDCEAPGIPRTRHRPTYRLEHVTLWKICVLAFQAIGRDDHRPHGALDGGQTLEHPRPLFGGQ